MIGNKQYHQMLIKSFRLRQGSSSTTYIRSTILRYYSSKGDKIMLPYSCRGISSFQATSAVDHLLGLAPSVATSSSP